MITSGRVYIAQPPLFLVKKGRQERYAFNEEERDAILEDLGDDKGVMVQRYKGLGEMNPDQLWETTLNPEKRTLLHMAQDDAMEAEHAFTMMMGDEVGPRRKYVEAHALEAEVDVSGA